MPRPRTIPDDDLLAAALDVVHRAGPEALSFAALAQATGLAASTLVQRFGSKAALLQSALLLAWDRLDELTADAAAAAPLDPAGVVELLVALSGQYDPGGFADQLLVLREDLRDPSLRARGARWLEALARAVDERVVRPGAPAPVGPLVVAHWQGTLTVWSFTRPAPLDEFVRRSTTSLLVGLGALPG